MEEKKEAEKDKVDDIDFKKIMEMSIVKGISTHDFILKSLREKLNKQFNDEIFFPMLGIGFEKQKKFIFLLHDSPQSIKDNKVMIMKLENISEKELKKFFEFVKKNKGDD